MNWRTIAKKMFPYHDYARNLEMELVKKMLSGENSLLLDSGCGDGTFSQELEYTIIGVDVDPEEIRPAKDRLYELIICDSADLPIRDTVIDAGLSNSVMEHVPRVRRAIFESCRVLKRGGRLVLTLPADEDPSWLKAINRPLFGLRHILSGSEWIRYVQEGDMRIVDFTRYQSKLIHHLYIVSCIFPPLLLFAIPLLRLVGRIEGTGVHICITAEKN